MLRLSAVVLGFAFISSAVQAENAEGSPEPIGGVVRYIELKPTFVTNFGISDSGHLRYVKADITVRVSNKNAEYAARYHLPALRDRLVLLLSRQDESAVASAAGRETIKAEAIKELREVLRREEGEDHIEDLMFTNFVVQR
ncbi:MAG: flagellar basal body-associated protein FliL [Gammaproteobacteria bacterium]|nr:flagellar basal body-associated protein FliL [Gammaproteobacteria bacterium]